MCVTGGIVAPVDTLSVQGNYTQTGGPAAVPVGTRQSQRYARGYQRSHPRRHRPGRLCDTGALCSIDPVHPPDRRQDQRHVRAIHFLPAAVRISFPLRPVYIPTSVEVRLTRIPFGAVAGLTRNQRAAGKRLEAAYLTTLTGLASRSTPIC